MTWFRFSPNNLSTRSKSPKTLETHHNTIYNTLTCHHDGYHCMILLKHWFCAHPNRIRLVGRLCKLLAQLRSCQHCAFGHSPISLLRRQVLFFAPLDKIQSRARAREIRQNTRWTCIGAIGSRGQGCAQCGDSCEWIASAMSGLMLEQFCRRRRKYAIVMALERIHWMEFDGLRPFCGSAGDSG